MKNTYLLILIFLFGCSNSEFETLPIGSSETDYLNIIDFPENQKPKNIVLVVGDGTGINQITLSRIVKGGPDHKLAIDQLPINGISLTHPYGNLITDSAAAATAWATGKKTKNKYLSIDHEKNILKTLPEMLYEKGYISGIVATSSITHATPAAFFAHIDSRYKEKEIANQFLNSPINIGLGGGLEFFDIEKASESHVLLDRKELLDLDFISDKKILGLFDKDGIVRSEEKPTQRQMTAFALQHLSKNIDACTGFFLMTEGSQIDWAAHDNDAKKMLIEFDDFDNTVKDLINFVTNDKNTLLIITADHETGGLQIMKQNNKNVLVKWGTGSHTGTPVGVYAYGPGAHKFSDLMDNTDIHYKILDLISYDNLNESICELYQ